MQNIGGSQLRVGLGTRRGQAGKRPTLPKRTKHPKHPTRSRYSGWPSRGKRFGEADNPGPTSYYPPCLQSGIRAFAFRGHEDGHC
eukprot:2431804-Heterocapsa_arctica.AAC.1